MTDPIEVLATACSTSQTDHDWPAAIDAVVRLRDAARQALPCVDPNATWPRDKLAAALAPFAQEER